MSLLLKILKPPIWQTNLIGWVYDCVYILVVIEVENVQFGLKSILLLGNPCPESPVRSCKVWCDQILHRYPCFHICSGSRRDPHHIIVSHEIRGQLCYDLNLQFFLAFWTSKERHCFPLVQDLQFHL